MRYFSVNFSYHVSREEIEESWKKDPDNALGWISSPAQDEAAWEIEAWLNAFFCGTGLPMRHDYSYPDGSCYKLVAFEGDADSLHEKLNDLFERYGEPFLPNHLSVENVKEVSPDKLTHKIGGPTVAELFADREKETA